jgi:hypothetical protein
MSSFDTQISQALGKIDNKISELKDGNTPTETELLALITPLIPEPVKGDKGDPAEEIKLADIEERLDDLEKDMKGQKGRVFGGGIMGRDLFKDIDISAQLDGSTKTFNIQAVWNIISISASSSPFTLRKNVDFSFTPTSVTFLAPINASTVLAAGQTVIITAVA